MQRIVKYTPTADKIIHQLPLQDRRDIQRALRDTDKLIREARKLHGGDGDVWSARIGQRRLLFKIENGSLLVVGLYDRSYLGSGS